MSDLIFSANIVMPLFLLIVVGALVRKLNIIDDSFVAKGNKLSFNVFMPVLLFFNVYTSKDAGYFNAKFALQLVSQISAIFFIAWLFYRLFYKDNRKLSVLIQSAFRANFVLFGTYLMTNMYGASGTAMASSYLAVLVTFFNILATFILEFYSETKSSFIKKVYLIIKNPLIIASLLGILINITGFRFGVIVEKTLSNIASIATNFAMICLGGNLTLSRLKKDKWHIAVGSFVRLIIVPLVSCVLFYVLGYRREELMLALLIFGTPVAVSSYIMAVQQGADGDLAGGLVASTTLLSVISLFFFIYAFRVLGLF